MQASNKVFFKASLSIALVAMMFIAPATFAKKDLFGSDPAGKPSKQSQQLISEPAPATQETSAEKLTESPPAPEAATPKSVSKKEKTSYIESQLVRLKLNIIETKNDLFGSGNKTKSTGVKQAQQAEPVAVESLSATSASQPAEIATAISPSAASLRAQRLAVPVRLFHGAQRTRSGRDAAGPRDVGRAEASNRQVDLVRHESILPLKICT